MMIIFFSVKADMLLFSNLIPRRPPGGLPKLYFGLKFLYFFKIFKISYQNRASGGLLGASWVSDLKKATSQLSLKKKLIPLSFFEQNLSS